MLSEVPHELSTDAHSKECKRSPQQFIPAGFPLHNQLPTGTEDSAIPLTTPDMVRSGRVLLTSVKSLFSFIRNQRIHLTDQLSNLPHLRIVVKIANAFMAKPQTKFGFR